MKHYACIFISIRYYKYYIRYVCRRLEIGRWSGLYSPTFLTLKFPVILTYKARIFTCKVRLIGCSGMPPSSFLSRSESTVIDAWSAELRDNCSELAFASFSYDLGFWGLIRSTSNSFPISCLLENLRQL